MSFLIPFIKPLAYASLPLIGLRQVAVGSSFARYYARVAIYVGTLVTVASCSFIVAAGFTLIGRSNDVNNFVAVVFYGIVSRALELTVEVEGEENLKTSPAILMANHQSMLDILIIGRLMPKQTAIMAKKSLQYTPLGPFMTLSGTIFIDRGNNARAVRSIEAAGEKMKATKTSLWMFPEGTRRMFKTPDMLPLKKGGFHLAVNAGIPIVPIVTENYWHMYRKGVFESGVIKVRVLPPIPTTSVTAADVGVLVTRVREDMLEALRDISQSSKANEIPSPEEKPRGKVDNSKGPIEPIGSLMQDSISAVPDVSLPSRGSSSSLASSSVASSANSRSKAGASENGAETEEDEGMVLVGRPPA